MSSDLCELYINLFGSKAEFRSRVILVRERMTSKEQEILGQWMTREKMEKSGDFSPYLALKSVLI